MTYQDITPEQAGELLQNAQAEILMNYEDFVNTIATATIAEVKDVLEEDEKNEADRLLDDL